VKSARRPGHASQTEGGTPTRSRPSPALGLLVGQPGAASPTCRACSGRRQAPRLPPGSGPVGVPGLREPPQPPPNRPGSRPRSLRTASGLVFATTIGTPLDAQDVVNRHFKPLLRRACLPDIRFHDPRHTCATLLTRKNVNPKIVQNTLGHARLTMTLGVYSHVQAAMKDEATAAMDSTFS
jgi:hypothetical protein